MHKRGSIAVGPCSSFCLYVRLSVTFVCCIETAEDIIELFSHPGTPSFRFIELIRYYPVPSGTPAVGALSTDCQIEVASGWIGIPNSRPISRYILETVRYRAVVTIER